MILATIAEGHADLSDLLLLVAVFLFVVAAVIAGMAHAVETVLLTGGLALVALAFLVL